MSIHVCKMLKTISAALLHEDKLYKRAGVMSQTAKFFWAYTELLYACAPA